MPNVLGAKKAPFVGGAGTYEGQDGEGNPSRIMIMNYKLGCRNPYFGVNYPFSAFRKLRSLLQSL